MHEYCDTRPGEPPKGGIFLSKELYIPPEITRLIDCLQDYKDQSEQAKQELDNLFAARTGMTSNEEYAQYLRLLREEVIHKIRHRQELNPDIVAYAAHIEAAEERAGLYTDALSAITNYGKKVAAILATYFTVDSRTMGSHSYSSWYDERPYGQRWYLTTFDGISGKVVLYNYYEKITEPLTRAAQVTDYVQVINDVALEQARLGITLPPPEVQTAEIPEAIAQKNKEWLLAHTAYAYSYRFGLRYHDLLMGKSGQIIQVKRSGIVVPGESSKDRVTDYMTLNYFRAEDTMEPFHWQLITAFPESGSRKAEILSVTPDTVTARRILYDARGSRIKEDISDPEELFQAIFGLAEHEITKQEISRKRQQLTKRRDLIAAAAVSAVMKPTYSSQTYGGSPGYLSPLEEQAEQLKSCGWRPAVWVK